MLVVGDYGEVVLVGVNEEGVGIKDVGGGFVYWDVCYCGWGEVGGWNININININLLYLVM